MNKKIPQEYTKGQIDRAGFSLRDSNKHDQYFINATEILNHWRTIHVNPLNIVKRKLNNLIEEIDINASTAYRLKRQHSVIKKLKRRYANDHPTMKLSQMQDIAGCRIVVSDMELIDKLYDHITKRIKYEKVGEKDYIVNPKYDGYRSIHLIYRYKSKTDKLHNEFLVEIQLRTQLQHSWATAVETVGLFTDHALKSNEGSQEWQKFFKLVSSVFTIKENTTQIIDAPDNINELYSQIKSLSEELDVIERMEKWATVVRTIPNEKKDHRLYLLILDLIGKEIEIKSYTNRENNDAFNDYKMAERADDVDAVLVHVNKIKGLREAYPNYFADTKEFLTEIKRIIYS